SAKVREALESRPNIRFERSEVTSLDPDAWTILATGPLTSEALARDLFARVSAIGGGERLFFYDSIAPVVFADSLEEEHIYTKNRWDKGTEGGNAPDFLNVPLDKEQYEAFVEALVAADTVEAKPFEKGQLFEGCLPIEE